MYSRATHNGKRTPIIALIGGDFISQFGNAVTTIALPWFVLESTGSATLTGIVFIALFLPMPLVTFFAGALVDRVRKTRLSIIADLASGVSIALIPLLHHTVGISYWQLLLLVFTGAVLDGPGFSARRSLVPELTKDSGISLERANSAFQVNWSASVLVAPALGGLLIAVIGSTAALWFDAATFLASALLVALCVPNVGDAEAAAPEADQTNYLEEIWAGLRWIRNDRRLLQVLVSASITMTVIAAFMTVVMPVYADAVFDDPVSLGLLVAGFGLGSLVGSLAFGHFGSRLPSWATYVAATAVLGLPFIFLALEPALLVAAGLAAVVGFAFGPIIPSMDTLIQQQTSDAIRGRVFSTRFALNNAVKLPGLLLIGLALDGLGLAPALLALGVVAFLIAAGLVLRRVDTQVVAGEIETFAVDQTGTVPSD